MTQSVLSYLLALIGFSTPTEEHQQKKNSALIKQQQQQLYYREEKCKHLTDSAFVLSASIIDDEKTHLNHETTQQELQDYLGRLSKLALYQILTSTLQDYPQAADGILTKQRRYYEKTFFYEKNKPKSELKSIQKAARKIATSLDKLRPSEQFGRAGEVADQLHQLLISYKSNSSNSSSSSNSFINLFNLIILAQESLNAPPEVRQHIFYHAKLGRTIILEMSSILKNFCLTGSLPIDKWSVISPDEDWLTCLQKVCSKMARYDVTWEYRKEYQEVSMIAERYYHHYLL